MHFLARGGEESQLMQPHWLSDDFPPPPSALGFPWQNENQVNHQQRTPACQPSRRGPIISASCQTWRRRPRPRNCFSRSSARKLIESDPGKKSCFSRHASSFPLRSNYSAPPPHCIPELLLESEWNESAKTCSNYVSLLI